MKALGQEDIRREIDTLDHSNDSDEVAAAAVKLAGSRDREALDALRSHLGRREFLERLDHLEDPQESVTNLSAVFAAFPQQPDPLVEQLCIELAHAPDFVDVAARLNFLLPVLAAVRPMGESAANIFRQTNQEGFYAINAPLLAENGSPNALVVFREMMQSADIDSDNKVYLLHHALVRRRTHLPLLQTAVSLIGVGLEHEVEMGVIESIFDYQQRPWYGNLRAPPRPPAWESAPLDVLRFVRDLGTRLQTRGDLRPGLSEAIDATITLVSQILVARGE